MVKVKGIVLNMGGADYVVPPLSLGALEQLQERIAAFTGDASNKEQVATAIDATFAALKRNYPDLTRQDVAELIDLGNMGEVFEAVMDVSGMKRKAVEQGEAQGSE